jgi:hypothetical protein
MQIQVQVRKNYILWVLEEIADILKDRDLKVVTDNILKDK